MAADFLDQVRAANGDPCLRTSEEFVARECDEMRTCFDALLHGWLISQTGECSGAEIVHENELGALGEADKLSRRRLLGKADDSEIGLMHAEQDRRILCNRLLVIPIRVRFVVPTSTRLAPERTSTSGIRNPSPISMSSPLETSTSRSSASAASTSIVAAALLLTTSAASAPVSLRSAKAT